MLDRSSRRLCSRSALGPGSLAYFPSSTVRCGLFSTPVVELYGRLRTATRELPFMFLNRTGPLFEQSLNGCTATRSRPSQPSRRSERSRHGRDVIGLTSIDQAQELPQCVPFDDRITEREVRIHAIKVAPPQPTSLDIAGVLQVTEDPIRVALGNAGNSRNFAHPRMRPLGDGEQHLGVIRDERPPPRRRCLT